MLVCVSHLCDYFVTFNVAASIKMRKFNELVSCGLVVPDLQCGRIYKDAEICV